MYKVCNILSSETFSSQQTMKFHLGQKGLNEKLQYIDILRIGNPWHYTLIQWLLVLFSWWIRICLHREIILSLLIFLESNLLCNIYVWEAIYYSQEAQTTQLDTCVASGSYSSEYIWETRQVFQTYFTESTLWQVTVIHNKSPVKTKYS